MAYRLPLLQRSIHGVSTPGLTAFLLCLAAWMSLPLAIAAGQDGASSSDPTTSQEESVSTEPDSDPSDLEQQLPTGESEPASNGDAADGPSTEPDKENAFKKFDKAFGDWLVNPVASIFFFDIIFWDNKSDPNLSIPFIVAWLVTGAIFFTFRMLFINLRGFKHAISVTWGTYDDPNDAGEISHFQALSSALSATVGLGNIAGVAIAVGTGGPGAIFWMIVAGFLGMSSKFTECTLGQMYRKVDFDGRVLGGPMRYLNAGLSEMGQGGLNSFMRGLGLSLSILFAILCIGGSFGGGNMFQANQSFAAVKDAIPFFADKGWLYGLLLAFVVGLVILGGIRSIGRAAGVIVPFMCLIYVVAGIFVLIINWHQIPAAFGKIFHEAFTPEAGVGGALGVLIIGFQRAAFSNEAGTGSASIAHSAAATEEPVREGIVALLEPFIDTIVVCTMTGLVVVITGVYTRGDVEGVAMTSAAFEQSIPWFPYILTVCVVLFAFSTMISWSYYGERCATWLFGERASVPYKVIFLAFVVVGSVFELGNVLGFSDLMILGMAFPNVLGLVLLSGKVKRALDEYWTKYKSGKFKPQK